MHRNHTDEDEEGDTKPRAIDPHVQEAVFSWKHRTGAELEKKKITDLQGVLAKAGLQCSARKKKAEIIDFMLDKIKEGFLTEKHFDPICPIAPVVAAPITTICTLIVAPVSVLTTWVHQIQDHVKEGVLRVEIYRGTSSLSIRLLARFSSSFPLGRNFRPWSTINDSINQG